MNKGDIKNLDNREWDSFRMIEIIGEEGDFNIGKGGVYFFLIYFYNEVIGIRG